MIIYRKQTASVALMILAGLSACSTSTGAGTGDSESPLSSSSPTVAVSSAATASAGDGVPRGLTPQQKRVDRRNGDAVASAFAIRLETFDTAIDRRPGDSARRAAVYATEALRSKMLASRATTSPPGSRWNALQEHGGWVSVTTKLGGLGPRPADTKTAGLRAVSCYPVDHGSGNWSSWPDESQHFTYVVQLHRSQPGAQWAVASYSIQ